MMFNKIKKLDFAEIMEHVMAAIVVVAIFIAIFALKDSLIEFWINRNESGAFLEFMGVLFNIVIGIEFFKLLWKPGKDTLLEVLMFVVARHMIIERTTVLENLVSILGIAILFAIDKYLLKNKKGTALYNKDNKDNKNIKINNEIIEK